MDQRLDDCELIHGQTIWTDTDGNLRIDNWTMPKREPSLAGCIPCFGCTVMVNLSEYPDGWCYRCSPNKHQFSSYDRPLDEKYTQAHPTRKMKEAFNANR